MPGRQAGCTCSPLAAHLGPSLQAGSNLVRAGCQEDYQDAAALHGVKLRRVDSSRTGKAGKTSNSLSWPHALHGVKAPCKQVVPRKSSWRVPQALPAHPAAEPEGDKSCWHACYVR